MIRHNKPRWLPIAPSKKFKLLPQSKIAQAEIDQILKLKWEYRDRLAAISQYLYEDYLRHSDVGEAAKEAARKEEEEHVKLLEENEKVNQIVAKKREIRLKKEAIEAEEQIREHIKELEREETEKIARTEELIRAETEAMENRIKQEDFERAVEIALDNPIDHEFAIDLQGNIYRGRETKSILVAQEDRESIPRPQSLSETTLESKMQSS